MSKTLAAILVGGKGQRMGGCDKASLKIPGTNESFLERTQRLLRPFVDEVVCVGRQEQSLNVGAIRFLQDQYRESGPIAGLERALSLSEIEWCLLLSCDLPRLDGALLESLLEGRGQGCPIVLPKATHGIEPTCALYHVSLLAPLRAFIEQGGRALHEFVGAQNYRPLRLSAGQEETLKNINRREDYEGLGE
ncbi:MAG: molybdenum cofactor guanylyltransferase [Myxococcota bacterium]|nr:molybdenum cofactor guanylyltransferase [Myxococcota bacterium]